MIQLYPNTTCDLPIVVTIFLLSTVILHTASVKHAVEKAVMVPSKCTPEDTDASVCIMV